MSGIVSRRGIIAGPMNKENHRAKRPATSPAVRDDEVPVTKPSATEASRVRPEEQPASHPGGGTVDTDPSTRGE